MDEEMDEELDKDPDPHIGVANLKRKSGGGDSSWVSPPSQKRMRRSGDSDVVSDQTDVVSDQTDVVSDHMQMRFRRKKNDPAPPFETLTTGMGAKLCPRVVRIIRIEPDETNTKKVLDWRYPGTILQSEGKFCYIIADERATLNCIEHTEFYVFFIDGSGQWVERSDFKTVEECGLTALLCVMDKQMKGGDIEKIEYGPRVSRNEKVFLPCYDAPDKHFCTGGEVNVSEEDGFTYNCGAEVYSHLGASVYNEAGQLVGLSNGHTGAVKARHADWIHGSISVIHEGLQAFEDIFQQAKTEALSRANAEAEKTESLSGAKAEAEKTEALSHAETEAEYIEDSSGTEALSHAETEAEYIEDSSGTEAS